MARQKEFDPQQALSKAQRLFWQQGYEATSMTDLVAHLGLSRSSIYDTFGDKRQLYLAALDNYCELALQTVVDFMETSPSVRDGLRRFLMLPVRKLLAPEGTLCGCFMVNSAIEFDADPEVNSRYRQLGHNQKVVLVEAIAGAQARGEISDRYAATALAEHIMNAMRGLNAIPSRSGDRHALEGLVQTTLAVFD